MESSCSTTFIYLYRAKEKGQGIFRSFLIHMSFDVALEDDKAFLKYCRAIPLYP